MDSLIETWNTWAEHLPGFVWPMFWQSSVLIAAVLALDLALRHRVRAAIRYALWLIVLVKLVLPPTFASPTSVAYWLIPAQQMPPAPIPNPTYIVTYGNTAPLDLPMPVVPVLLDQAEEIYRPQPTRAAWLLIAWAAAGAWLTGLLCRRTHLVRQRLARASAPANDLSGLLEECRRKLRLRCRIHLRISDGNTSPAVCGLFRPVVLLPRQLTASLSQNQLRAVLLHELIHLKRGDVWVNCAQTLLQVFYWWHPLLWLANARIRRVREEAVDDAVMLALEEDAETYAPTLLEVAKLAFNRPLTSLGLVGILESRSALRQRIERLMDFRPPRKAGLTMVSALCVLAFAALAVPMGEPPPENPDTITPTNAEAPQAPPAPMPLRGRLETAEGVASSAHANAAVRASIAELRTLLEGGSAEERIEALVAFSLSPMTVAEGENPVLGEALPLLITATRDKDDEVRVAAIRALARLKSPRPEAVTVLGNLAASETNLKAAFFAAEALKELGPAAAPAVPSLIRALKERNVNGTFKDSANNQVVPGIMGLSLRQAAIEALGNIGPAATDAIPVLRELMEDRGPFSARQRTLSAKAMWQITGKASESLPVLISELQSYDSSGAAHILGLMESDASPAIPALQAALQSRVSYTRLQAALALNKVDPQFPFPLPMMMELLNDEFPHTRFRAAEAIWSVSRDAPAILPTLMELLTPTNPELPSYVFEHHAQQAIQLLIEIGPPAKLAIPALKAIEADTASRIRSVAAEAIRKLETEPEVNQPPQGASVPTTGRTRANSNLQSIDGGLIAIPATEARPRSWYEVPPGPTYSYSNEVGAGGTINTPASAGRTNTPLAQSPSAANAGANTGLGSISKGRQNILDKLDRIRLPWVAYEGVAFTQVVRDLNAQSRILDPAKRGINFIVNPNVAPSTPPRTDAATGKPSPPLEPPDLKTAIITINPPLTDARLKDVLDAVVKAADKPIQYSIEDYAVVFSPKAERVAEPLFVRTFKVDTNVFLANLRQQSGVTVTNDAELISLTLRKLLSDAGVELQPPQSLYFNSRGMLFARATLHDLDRIEEVVQQLNYAPPQIHIKAHFVELEQTDASRLLGFGWYPGNILLRGITATNASSQETLPWCRVLTEPQFRTVRRALEQREGVNLISSPEVTTLSGRQAQIQMVDMKTTVVSSTNGVLQTNTVPCGSVLDVLPTLGADGYTIQITATPRLTEFLGYDDPGHFVPNDPVAPSVTGSSPAPVLILPLPRFRVRQVTKSAVLWDGQTLVIGGLSATNVMRLKYKVPVLGDLPPVGRTGRSIRSESTGTQTNTLLVFITARLVDPAGNPIHTDDRMPFKPDSIPPQPPDPK
jgi:beta-lactamase regulating signal transducer with metallopeptidase domain/type II secretory pathway component GspD/PulD (secretin)/HEAT repeat protein